MDIKNARVKNTWKGCDTLAQDKGRRRLFEYMRDHGEQVETLWDQGRQSDT